MSVLTRRDLLKGAVGGLILSGCSKAPRQKTVNFFNWFTYIGKETLPGFERETGIKVNYEIYSSEEEMFTKLKAGVRGYDLIVATDYMIPRLKALNLIDPIPHDLLQNVHSIAARFRDPIFDPGLAYSLPYLWGTTGVGYSKTRFPKPPDSWRALWDEKNKGRISMLDNVRDCIACALLLLGLPTDSKDPGHLAKARDLLIEQRPLLKQYTSSTYTDDLTAGELWLAQGWSGDVLQAARENKSVDYMIPKEGSFLFVDNLCLIRGSGARAEALRLMDHILRPDVAAEIANTVRYATPNAKAMPLLDASLRADPRVFPTRAIEARLHFHTPLDPEADEAWNQVWQEVKVL